MSSNETFPMAQATAILVLGMHRSGTSATTRVLNLLGADLGSNLLEAQADNAKGFWEHAEAVEIHEELLAALGRTWHDVREMPDGWLEQPASYAAIDKIVHLIRGDFAGKTLWSVKDPRMCRLVPLWREALRRVGVRAAALVVVRKPDEVAGSLLAREGWSEAHSDLMWTQHSLEAIRYTNDMPRSMIRYDDLLADWRHAVGRIGSDLGIEWPCQDEEVFQQIDAFISPDDRHHRSPDEMEKPVPSAGSSSVVAQLYSLCADVAAGRAEWSVLEQFDTRYLEAANLYRWVTQQKYKLDGVALERINHIRLLEGELQSVGKQVAQFSGLAAERANHIQLLASQHQHIIDVATERETRIHELEGIVAKSASQQDELHQTMARLQAVTDELRALKTMMADLSVRHGRQIEENEQLSKRCIELDGALRQEQAQGVESAVELADLREHRAQLSQMFELTLNRRWLLRRFWDVTIKGSTLRAHGRTR
ncbi:hypothetical protein [Dyella sp. C11]|uniref:sulfotransferase family protein n=1 Tax=Dyella sp. C11 TaxID=2126991 RepID=UPI00130066AA|nr:hypothetical protein [Dyella sp. C11]